MTDDEARENAHEDGDEAETALPRPDDEVAAAILDAFAGSVFASSHGQAVVYVSRDAFAA